MSIHTTLLKHTFSHPPGITFVGIKFWSQTCTNGPDIIAMNNSPTPQKLSQYSFGHIAL